MATAIFLVSLTLTFGFATIFSGATVTEVDSLLAFKRNLNDPLGVLDGWDASTPLAPCDWRGVGCYFSRVDQLRLPRLQLTGVLSPELGKLRQLRRLSLHSNHFHGSIPRSFTELSLIRALYLHNNSLSGDVPPGILSLSNLQIVNLAGNDLSGRISGGISPSLRVLDLSYNNFSGLVPANFSESLQLTLINLSSNRFSGEIPASIGALKRLQYLWLDSNLLVGTLPSAILNCTSLVHISAEDNFISGNIPATIGAMPELEVLSLTSNKLSGVVPASVFCNVSNPRSLRFVFLGFNALTGIAKPPNGCTFRSGLEVLDLHGNRIVGEFPDWVADIPTLRVLDLSGNLFTGSLFANFGNLMNLEEFRVANNSLKGQVPKEIGQCSMLRVLDLEGNQISGKIPEIFQNLSNLRVLSLGRNRFLGLIDFDVGSIQSLEVLNLSENELTGVVPNEVLQLTNLTTLNLSFNNFSGHVPVEVGDLKSLAVLNLSHCGFSGSIPSSIGSLMRLRVLDLSKQRLSGNFPAELFGLPNLEAVALQENDLHGDIIEGFSSLVGLRYLNLSSNSLSGDIPATFGFLRSLNVLSLSNNRVSGEIPPELGNCSELQVLELARNRLVGNIPNSLSRLSHLEELDLGHNNLDGNIPKDISKCSDLLKLVLDFNHFSGPIPGSLSKLLHLRMLDLSSNNLSGSIPENLTHISSLQNLNLSSNHFEGEIPKTLGSDFSDPSVFADNGKLCGYPLKKECSYLRRRKMRKLMLIIGVALAGLLFLALCCCGYIISLLRWREKLKGKAAGGEKKPSPPRKSSGAERSRSSSENGVPKLVMFTSKITLAEALEATRQFDEENVLSRGKYGMVFKASFADGMVLAIRRLPDGFLDDRGFKKEAEMLGKVKHRNITVLRGYYAGPPDIRLLVYDYMPNGNLATLLQEASHHDGHVLNWPMRHLIALGIARGITFLHSLDMVHGDIKPQNVLFDADFEAHLSEFGLDRLTIATPIEASTSTLPIGTLGYVAPEVLLTGHVSREGDVFSFGIVLLEILTGKKPIMFEQDEDIVKWVKKQLQTGQISELIDPGLLELDPESSEWEEFLLGIKVGLLCTAPDPSERPSMGDIVFMLEGCRVGPDIPSSTDPTSLPSPVG
ncbi:probable LRR receptor-like serine/threonine-protein kinase At4g36180 [Chenopodium quinoa]|uniref:non-specific serine/threonine protein kinase n=2 Tax=Chenopodium quinoa TaxID=63459 RepID=A0A803LVB2_CHEQI|nr:probable LRR receptor-like serine/threonine-protein kinase At4g36180 [Chenopodium quinoa]